MCARHTGLSRRFRAHIGHQHPPRASAAYRWTCPECGAHDITATETEAVMLGRRHVSWSHPRPTAPQLAAQAAAEQTAS